MLRQEQETTAPQDIFDIRDLSNTEYIQVIARGLATQFPFNDGDNLEEFLHKSFARRHFGDGGNQTFFEYFLSHVDTHLDLLPFKLDGQEQSDAIMSLSLQLLLQQTFRVISDGIRTAQMHTPDAFNKRGIILSDFNDRSGYGIYEKGKPYITELLQLPPFDHMANQSFVLISRESRHKNTPYIDLCREIDSGKATTLFSNPDQIIKFVALFDREYSKWRKDCGMDKIDMNGIIEDYLDLTDLAPSFIRRFLINRKTVHAKGYKSRQLVHDSRE
jgi:hypothetical protein